MKDVFVYGTLLDPTVRHDIVGRPTTTYSEVLEGYKRVGLNIVEAEGEKVYGATFEATAEELKKLDSYEGVAHGLYKRIKIKLESGKEAVAYQKVNADVMVYSPSGIG